nr:transposase [Pseudomonas nabeulensis]
MRSTPQTHRLRHGRYSELGRSYLITIVVHQRQRLFTDLFLGRLLVAELRQVHERGWVDSVAWVIMPDHIHWLFELKQQTLADVVRCIKSRSTLTINRRRQCKERVWQPGYYDRAVRVEDDIRTMARYIVANPLRAGLVDRVGNYALWDASWLCSERACPALGGAAAPIHTPRSS